MMLRREVRLPADLTIAPQKNIDMQNYGEYACKVRERINKSHIVARKHLKSAAKRQKAFYNLRQNFNKYSERDLVWYLLEYKSEGICPKLQPSYIGPYIITRKMSEWNYLVQLTREGKEKVVNVDKLKKYQGDLPEKWLKEIQKKLKALPEIKENHHQ
jgi:hypothetical protein